MSHRGTHFSTRFLPGQGLHDPGHDVVGAGQGNGVAQCLVAAEWADLPAVRAVFRPALRQAHEPLALGLGEEADAAARGVVLKVERERVDGAG